jgi:YHS domain-containing protein
MEKCTMTNYSILGGAALGVMLMLSGGTFAATMPDPMADPMAKPMADTMAKPMADTMAKPMADTMAAPMTTGFNTVDGIALHGFDPVAYFTQHKPVKGSPKFSASYNGVTYEFATASDAATFQKDPAKYVPAYNGFCTTAVSEGVKADIDPHAYVIDHGKLNVFFSDEARDHFLKDPAKVSRLAASNWPAVEKLDKIYR